MLLSDQSLISTNKKINIVVLFNQLTDKQFYLLLNISGVINLSMSEKGYRKYIQHSRSSQMIPWKKKCAAETAHEKC